MSKIDFICQELIKTPKKWLITGVAGFIGSNLLETLLKLNQKVIGLDNFETGYQHNLEAVRNIVTEEQWNNFSFYKGDIRNFIDCQYVCKDIDYILHQAALGSVPLSVDEPIKVNETNINGFLNMLTAARDAKVKSFTYAASSSTYGDHEGLPKVEENIGNPLSPYAVTKYVNELYADVFSRCYGFKSIGLRYFNVFGQRQDPKGAYSAVIPKWTAAMILNEDVLINGDGETTRDFCFINNVVQANILAATCDDEFKNQVYNVAVGGRTTLNELFKSIKDALYAHHINYQKEVIYCDFRQGDVRHSQASIEKIQSNLGYEPKYQINEGIQLTTSWYIRNTQSI